MTERLHVRDNRNGNWFFVHNDLIKKFGHEIGVYGIAVYNVLAMYANNDTQEACPSYATIADHIGCSRRQVMKVVDKLAEYNIIAKTTRQEESGLYDSNVIVLLHKDEWGSECHSLPEVVNTVHHPARSERNTPPVVNDIHGGGEPRSPKQDLKNKTKKQDYSAKSSTKMNGKGNLPKVDLEKLTDAIATICKIDQDLASNGKVQAIKSAAGRLFTKRVTADDIYQFKQWWYLADFRGKKGDPPQPDFICDQWERFKTTKLNGSPTAKLSDEQMAAARQMAAEEAAQRKQTDEMLQGWASE